MHLVPCGFEDLRVGEQHVSPIVDHQEGRTRPPFDSVEGRGLRHGLGRQEEPDFHAPSRNTGQDQVSAAAAHRFLDRRQQTPDAMGGEGVQGGIERLLGQGHSLIDQMQDHPRPWFDPGSIGKRTRGLEMLLGDIQSENAVHRRALPSPQGQVQEEVFQKGGIASDPAPLEGRSHELPALAESGQEHGTHQT